ncbi:uncharacterized protein BDZ99DRAFT_462356 [Mytilinidion resinicola]|uniref:Uncharacterized protein n=1 Tax=Mytilinidion resinicola TaxID=574789 RepID=A0A6A6YQP2_9PEZI|nr:uncharacterized protein BDZ99DRAFT_462356 [Mytilinidion resinicola]KAF2811081.1 hypothetical protein BDZ99DRAFT_462356 [Mytilinidion resinicola]
MAENLVSWQTAFWSLVPIALNTMLQPSGRVCGLDPELHTYLTSSPLVCAFDSIVILVRFLASWEYSRSFRFAIHDTLEERFPSPAQPTSGLRTLESATFICWLGFIVGTLPQFIKQHALTGVPWTQAWAWMYLINFSLVEILFFLDNIMGPPSPPARPFYPDPLYPDLIGYRLPTFNRVCSFLALATHFYLVEWTCKSLVALHSEPF